MLQAGLRYFLAVAQTGSIREASERLHIAQSAISRQIAKLEERFGEPLFERGPRGMVLSPAGEILLSHTREALLQDGRLDADMAALRGLQRGHVAVRSIESFAVSQLPGVLAAFTRRHPGITLDISVAETHGILPAVRDGLCHLGIAFNQPDDPDIEVRAAAVEALLAFGPPGHPILGRARPRLADLAEWPLALPSPRGGSRRLIDAACEAARVTLRPALETNSSAIATAFVTARQGVAIFSSRRVVPQVAAGLLAPAPLADPALRRARIVLLARRGRRLPPAGEAFATALAASILDPDRGQHHA